MPFDADRHVAEIESQGYSIAEGVLSDAFCDEIIEEIRRLEKIGPPSLASNEFTGFETLRYFDLLNQGEVWQRVAAHPPLLEVLRGVLGPDMLLSTMGTAVIGPGETNQRIHCDDLLYGIDRPHKHLVCNTMWALSDFTAENGATRLVPGSHRWPRDPDQRDPEAPAEVDRGARDPTGADQSYDTIQAVMPKGSVCFVVGTCYHSGAANRTNARRWALTINYCAGSQRQQENLMLAHTREKVASFPAEVQDLIGYRISRLGVGHVDAGDPRQLLETAGLQGS